jgi:hypothetical protein
MVKLSIEETSGVDHPAHMQEGWIVMKSTDGAEIREVFDSLTETTEEIVSEEIVQKSALEDALAKNEMLEKKIKEMEAMYKAAEEQVEEDITPEAEAEEILKSAPEAVIKMVIDAQDRAIDAEARAEAAEAVLKSEREVALIEETVSYVKSWENLSIDAEQFAPVLVALREIDDQVAKAVEDVLTNANARAGNADLFTEIGKSATPATGGDAYSRLTSLAKARHEGGQAETFEQAFADVAIENNDIYNDYLIEKGA